MQSELIFVNPIKKQGLPMAQLQSVFVVVLSRVHYAAPAWRGYLPKCRRDEPSLHSL